jgi:hypothetical protein
MTSSTAEKLKRKAQSLFGERWFYKLGYYYLLTQPEFRNSIRRLRQMKDRHSGERCFIIGNGASLRRMDLSPLANEITFGLNRIYLIFPKLNFFPTYYVSVDKLFIQQCGDEIAAYVPSLKFTSYDARRWIDFGPDRIFLFSREGPRFYPDITRGIWQGSTVTYVAMQIAYHMGFHKVILIGVDHSYSTSGDPRENLVSDGDDPDHFDPGYLEKGFRWRPPDLKPREIAYRLANSSYARAGREILDATVDGQLDIFPKVEYESLFH